MLCVYVCVRCNTIIRLVRAGYLHGRLLNSNPYNTDLAIAAENEPRTSDFGKKTVQRPPIPRLRAHANMRVACLVRYESRIFYFTCTLLLSSEYRK